MKTSINALHHQAADWLRELDFYKQETAILRKRLEEVAAKNTTQEVLAQVEHFQNKFIVLSEQNDILRHDTGEQSRRAEELAKAKPDHLEEKFVNETDSLSKRVSDFSASFRNTRSEFNSFLAKNL